MEANKETIIAFVRLLCGLVVYGASLAGVYLDVEMIYMVAMILVSVAVFVYSLWWKNNNVTKAAQEAQGYLDVIKKAEKVDRSDEEEAKG